MTRLSQLLTYKYAFGLLAVFTAALWLSLRGLPDGRLHVYFLDVGQGDAIFILAPDGRQILVDGGPDSDTLLSELGDLMPFWDRSLDAIILTHPDSDHMDGLLALPARYRIETALDTLGATPSDTSAAWIGALADAAIKRAPVARSAQLRAGDVLLTVLSPDGAPDDSTVADDNAGSLVLRLDYGATSLLLMGDAPTEVEQTLIEADLPLDADLLKVSHHGSAGSTSKAFVAAVSPQFAVIQVGAKNIFGHPAATVLERLHGVEVLRTDQNGRIEVISDGRQLTVKPEIRP